MVAPACATLLLCSSLQGRPFLPRAPPLPRAARVERVLCSASGGSDDDAWKTVRAADLSRELSKFQTPGARVRTSAPVRYAVSLLDDSRRAARGATRFAAELATVLPTNRLMLGAIVAAYGLQSVLGKAMLFAGARMNEYILYAGQWHRLVTPMWLHSSLMHLLSNSYSLFYLGPTAERVFGSEAFLLIFLLSGIGGNLLGLQFGAVRGMSVGASGAVFGLMGGLVGYAARNRGTASSQATLSSLSRVLVLNLVIGLRPHSGIDNLGHVGGFLTGAILGLGLAPVERPGYPRGRPRWGDAIVRLATVATIAAVVLSMRDFARLTIAYRGLRR